MRQGATFMAKHKKDAENLKKKKTTTKKATLRNT